MKKKLLKAMTFSVFLLVFNQICSAQSVNDKSIILQKCLDVAELQGYFPKNADNSFKQVVVLETSVDFSGVSVSKFNEPVLFEDRDEVYNSNPFAFIVFQSMTITANTADVNYEMTYDRNTTTPQSVTVNVSFEKNNNNWIVKKITINK